MSNTLSVRVSSRKSESGDCYEGTVTIAGLKPTKLARRSDGGTQFPTRSAVSGAARNLAKALGFTDIDVVDTTKAPVKVKAKTTKATKVATVVVAGTTTNSVVKKAAKKSIVKKSN